MKSISQLEEEVVQLRTELELAHKITPDELIERLNNVESFIYSSQEPNDGLWDWNLVTDEVYYSKSWKDMLGFNENELKPHVDTWANLVHQEDKDYVVAKFNAYLHGDEDAFEVEMRMRHKAGHYLYIRTRALQITRDINKQPIRVIGTHVDITQRKKADLFEQRYNNVIKMIAQGASAPNIYDEIAYLYEGRHTGIRCSMLELEDNILLHGGAPSLPKAYCDQVHGLANGPNVGSCGASTYRCQRVITENIETDPKWDSIKHIALPYGMKSCWSEPVISSTGTVLGAFGMYRDYPSIPNKEESEDLTAAARLASIVMERDHNLKRIKSLAYKDELTGLSSRAHLFMKIKDLIKESKRYDERFSLLYIDLDNFKSVNDSLGHDVGDYLLQQVASRLIDVSREADCVARIGGDEFCIVVKETANNFNAGNLASRITDIIAAPIELSNRHFLPTCSIGIARYPDDGHCLESMLKAADIGLYSAKNAGKNCYAFYNLELSEIAEYHFKVEHYLRETIENKKLSLVYQPQVDIETQKIVGVEVLSRWYHPELGEVSPVEFIAMAERIGMMKQLTEWVLYEACSQAVKWRKAGLPEIRIAVNISPSHLSDPDFIPYLNKVINATGMHSNCLELEITESVVQTNHEDFSIFESLKDLGVLLAIDDFGTGYSSFSSLKHLRVDYLKIDKYFISDMLKDKKTKLLIGSMLEIGHNLEYKIIAEGVETVEQLNELKAFNCDIAQGFLFSKPVKADAISQLLR